MDLRIEKTYRLLLAAFTKLLEQYRYEDVTVAMLCDEAMIRRTTFYKHFADKAEFFAFFVDSLRVNLLRRGEGVERAESESDGSGASHRAGGVFRGASDRDNIAIPGKPYEVDDEEASRAIFQGLVDFMLEHETLVDNIFKSSMTGMMMLVMEDKVAEAICERYQRLFVVRDEGVVTLEGASEFAAGGIVRLLQKWWASGHSKAGEEEFVDLASVMVARVLGL